MNFIDKVYYVFYCCQTGGRGLPISKEVDARRFDQTLYSAKLLLLLTIVVCVMDLFEYAGIVALIKNKDIWTLVMLGIFISLSPPIFIYFTASKTEEIVKYYEERRSDLRKADFWKGFIFGISSFLAIPLYWILKAIGMPLPIIQHIFNVN